MKIFSISIMYFLLLTSLSALNLVKTSAPINIEGFIDKYHDMSVTTISISNNLGDSDTDEGMPFDLAWPSAAFTSIQGTGRRIASWSLTSNYTPLVLTINASHLYCSDTGTYVHYCLDFHYRSLQFDESTKEATGEVISGDFRVSSGTEWNSTNTAPFNTAAEVPVITVDQDIRFCLAEDVDIDTVPSGVYTATVTLEVVGQD